MDISLMDPGLFLPVVITFLDPVSCMCATTGSKKRVVRERRDLYLYLLYPQKESPTKALLLASWERAHAH